MIFRGSLGVIGLLAAAASAAEPEPIAADALPQVIILAPRLTPAITIFGSATEAAELPATVSTVSEADQAMWYDDRPESLLQKTAGIVPSVGDGGLSTRFQARGFDVTNQIQYNGHPDIRRLFVRDLSTVERIEVVKGHFGVLYGQGDPGATINYIGKRPHGTGKGNVSFGADNEGAWRTEFDYDGKASPDAPLTWRVTGAMQEGQTWVDNVSLDRTSILGVLNLRLPAKGDLRLEVEQLNNQRPFNFGTVYANGRFYYDKSYVAPVSASDRRYRRYGLYLTQPLQGGWGFDAHYSVAEVRRNETLGGFWYAKDDKTLYGYYRELSDDADQSDARLALNKTAMIGESKHHLLFGWQRHQLDFNFSGPQSPAGFLIDIDNPDFSNVDFSALQLYPRTSREKQTEEGFFAFDRLQLGKNWNFLAGIRQTDLSIKSGSSATLAPVADLRHNTFSLAGMYRFNEHQSVYLSRSESFLPNRGQDRFGGFLSPRESRQYELGLHVGDENYVNLAVFDIAQSNLTAPDPLDKTAQVAIGSIRSQGMEFSFSRSLSTAWKLSGQAVGQDVRNEEKTNPKYGDRIASVPEYYGSLMLMGKSNKLEGWGALVWVGSRWGDANNTFKAPGYARLDLGFRHPLDATTDLRLNIRNLADKRYVEYVSDASNVFQGDRRNIMASIVHQF